MVTAEGGDGGGDCGWHKLLLMYALSRWVWMRVRFLAELTEFRLYYVQELLEELEDEGLVELRYEPWSRSSYWLRWVLSRHRAPMGHELEASLTERGKAHPELPKLIEEHQKVSPKRTYANRMCLAVGVIVAAFGLWSLLEAVYSILV